MQLAGLRTEFIRPSLFHISHFVRISDILTALKNIRNAPDWSILPGSKFRFLGFLSCEVGLTAENRDYIFAKKYTYISSHIMILLVTTYYSLFLAFGV